MRANTGALRYRVNKMATGLSGEDFVAFVSLLYIVNSPFVESCSNETYLQMVGDDRLRKITDRIDVSSLKKVRK